MIRHARDCGVPKRYRHLEKTHAARCFVEHAGICEEKRQVWYRTRRDAYSAVIGPTLTTSCRAISRQQSGV
jgi:hypothetical protein